MVTGFVGYGCARQNAKTSDCDVVECHTRPFCGERRDVGSAVESRGGEERLRTARAEIEVSEQQPWQWTLVEHVEQLAELHRSFTRLMMEPNITFCRRIITA